MTYTVKQERISHQHARIERHSDKSAVNAQLVLTIPEGGAPRRIDRINAAYSEVVSKTVTIEIVSGLGADFNETLSPIVISSDVRGNYVPTTDVWLSGDDSLVITAPAEELGVFQVETATIVGAITPVTGGGDATITVTSAAVAGLVAGKAISVTVVASDSASVVAGKVRTALGLDVDVTAGFTVSGATDKVILTAKVKAADDGTLNIASTNGTCTGLTPEATSANTTAGVAPGTATSTIVARLEEAGM